MRNILIIKCGDTYSDIKEELGSFDDWVIEQTNLPENVFKIFDLEKGDKLRHPGEYIAAIITGSHANVDEKHAWIKHLEDWIITAQYTNTHLLGICFGHQILAKALGGTVEKNPNGLNIGMKNIELSKEGKQDLLFKNTPHNSQNYFLHNYRVINAPLNASILASNNQGGIECFKVGKSYGVQFHPEFTSDILNYYIDQFKEDGTLSKGDKIKIKTIKQNLISDFLDISLKF